MHSRFEPTSQQQQSYTTAPARVERYLQELAAPLPAAEQAEWRLEAQQHLESLIAAHEELGLGKDEAIEAALRSFGEAQQIGESVARHSRQSALEARKEVVEGALSFNAPLIPAVVITILAILGYAYTTQGEAYLTFLSRLAVVFYIACPLLAGWNLGRKTACRRPVRDLVLVPSFTSFFAAADHLLLFAMKNHLVCLLTPEILAWLGLWLALSVGSACLTWQGRERRRRTEARRFRGYA